MKSTKKLAVVVLSAVLAGSAFAEPIPALAPQSIPPEAEQAIDSVNQAAQNDSVPYFDSRMFTMGLGALVGVFIYNLLPATSIISRSVPGVLTRAAARVGMANATRVTAISQLPMMTSAVIGALTGDYVYRKNHRMPGISSEIAEQH
jgi:hypothetical protein